MSRTNRVPIRGLAGTALGFALAMHPATAAMPLAEATLADLDQAMASGATSSVELTVLYLNRILAYDRQGPRLNAVPVLNPRALEEAARADALRALGVTLSPLHGVPFIVKDSFNVAGLPTSVGVAAWKGLVPTEDAFIVARMRQAGAVLLGKANLDTFASDAQGISEAFGAVRNPHGAKAVGGSSAGSAVAVAAGFAPIAFGGDTAGSLRMPASRNGIVSIRATLGLISTAGTAPGDPLFDVIGPMTRTVADLARVLDWIAVPDPGNPMRNYLPAAAQQLPGRYRLPVPARSLRGVTFAVPRRLASDTSKPPELLSPGRPILDAFASVRRKLEEAGARVIDVDVPADAVLDDTWYYDQDVSQAGEVARPIYDARTALVNIRVFASEFEKFCHGWCGDPASRMLDVAAQFDYPEFMQAFAVMRDRTGLEIDSAPVAAALRNAEEIAAGPLFAEWMTAQRIDALLFPASSDQDSDTRFGLNYLSELGAPGLFVPAALVDSGVGESVQPLGIALVAGRFQEQRLLELGAAVEATLGARVDPARTPPLAGEAIVFEGATAPARRSDRRAPLLTIDRATWNGQPPRLDVSGRVSDEATVADLRVYANGSPLTVTRAAGTWQARLAGDAGCMAGGLVLALAKDGSGNASAHLLPLAAAPACADD